jgi:hypothetical protein
LRLKGSKNFYLSLIFCITIVFVYASGEVV